MKEGTTLPLANSQPNIQPDQILASLDGDTKAFLRLLLQAAGKGLAHNGPKLAAGLKRFQPTARDLAKLNGALAKRHRLIARAITNFGPERGARSQRHAARRLSAPNPPWRRPRQEASLRGLLRELPGTLRETRSALASGNQFALQLGPASRGLIPAAKALGPALRQTRPLFRKTVGPIQHEIRPFSRVVQTPLKHLKQASKPLAKATTGLTKSFRESTSSSSAAYNPPGTAQEGYLPGSPG